MECAIGIMYLAAIFAMYIFYLIHLPVVDRAFVRPRVYWTKPDSGCRVTRPDTFQGRNTKIFRHVKIRPVADPEDPGQATLL